MILEFKNSRNTLFIGGLIGIIVILLLFIFTEQAFVMLVFVFFYPWMLYRYAKRVSMRAMQDLERLMYLQEKPKQYLETYLKLIENNKSRDERWQLQKHHSVMVAALVLNNESLFNQYQKEVESRFSNLFRILPVFNYFNQVLKAMAKILFENKHSIRPMLDAFKKLDPPVQAQILNNANSFHNWVLNEDGVADASQPYVIRQLNQNRNK